MWRWVDTGLDTAALAELFGVSTDTIGRWYLEGKLVEGGSWEGICSICRLAFERGKIDLEDCLPGTDLAILAWNRNRQTLGIE